MGAVGQQLPPWGGALGRLAKAITNVGNAIDSSGSDDARFNVQHGARGELRMALVDDDDLDEWGEGGGSGLNQFAVSVQPGSTANGWLVTVLGGTAQAIFGASTMIPTVEEERVSISPGYYCFVSAVYKIIDTDNEDAYVHEFEEDLDFHVGDGPPQSTIATAYFPIAVIDSDGNVLQGHLGAIYLASPRNTVDKPD